MNKSDKSLVEAALTELEGFVSKTKPYIFCLLALTSITLRADDLKVTLACPLQSGGQLTGKPVVPLLLLPSKGVIVIDNLSLADCFIVVKNASRRESVKLGDAKFELTLYSEGPSQIDEVKRMPKELTYDFHPVFPHQSSIFELQPGECRVYEINFFKNKTATGKPQPWLWVTGITKVKIKSWIGILRPDYSETATEAETDWIPVAVQVPQFNATKGP